MAQKEHDILDSALFPELFCRCQAVATYTKKWFVGFSWWFRFQGCSFSNFLYRCNFKLINLFLCKIIPQRYPFFIRLWARNVNVCLSSLCLENLSWFQHFLMVRAQVAKTLFSSPSRLHPPNLQKIISCLSNGSTDTNIFSLSLPPRNMQQVQPAC